MKKLFTLLLLNSFFFMALFSAYYENVPVNLKQADGTVINCFLSGDEFSYRIHDKDNYTLILNPNTANYEYALLNQESLTPSGISASKNPPAMLQKNLIDLNRIAEKQRYNRLTQPSPNSGTLYNIVVFLQFSGDTGFEQPFSQYDSWINQEDGPSLKNYYETVSYQKMTVNSIFLPLQSTENVLSFTDTYSRDYYRPYSATNTIGYQDENEGFQRLHTCLQNAITQLDSQLDDSIVVDGDNDGLVDNVCFIVSGNTDNWADVLWPHMWNIPQYTTYLNNKMVFNYNLQIENFLAYSGRDVSVLCHEMFHSIGAPDLYHYNYDGFKSVGSWDLMENDAKQHMCAYMKFRYGNWITDIPVINQSGTFYLHDLTQPQNNVFKVYNPQTPNQYYILEYRKQAGIYEGNLPGSGLLVYRVNTDFIGQGNRDGNLGGTYNELVAYRPDGTAFNTGNIDQAFLSLESGRTSVNATSSIAPFLVDNSMGSLNITNIGSAGDSISFYVTIDTPVLPVYPPRNLRGNLLNDNDVFLQWDPPLDTQGLLGYIVYRDEFNAITPLIQATSYTDIDVQNGAFDSEHYYVVIAIYTNDNYSEPSNFFIINVIPQVSTDNPEIKPLTTQLISNYPNPFNPSTEIKFSLAESGNINLEIFNAKGQRIRSIINNQFYNSGFFSTTWDGKDENSNPCPSSVYFYRLTTSKNSSVKKMLMIK